MMPIGARRLTGTPMGGLRAQGCIDTPSKKCVGFSGHGDLVQITINRILMRLPYIDFCNLMARYVDW